MELEIIQEKLIKALNITSRIASPKAGLPILNNILFRTHGSSLIISSTNLEVAIVSSIGAKVIKPGSITVPARLLTEFISNLPKGIIKLSVNNNQLKIKSDNYISNINGISSDDFPELPLIDEKLAVKFKINVDNFKESISETITTASNDNSRPSLTGVYFNSHSKNLYIAATDGYRLSEKLFINNIKSEIKAIVPVSSLQEVLRSISDTTEEVELLFDENQVKFKYDEIEITSKLIDGSFPDYRQLIPKSTEINLELNKDEFLRVTKLASLFARESGGSIILETNQKNQLLSIKSVASELGENNSNIKTDIDLDGKITLNSRFLIDALNNIVDKKVKFGFSGKLAPAVIRNKSNSDYTHIIMPLKS